MKNKTQSGACLAARRPLMCGLTVLAAMISQAYAQDATPQAAPGPETAVVVVEGYRASLQTSANEKKKSVGFQDAVFAEDIGKFPDANIADSLSRIPGIQITREITGEGLNIQIRGLGPSFTQTLLNGAPVATASGGRTDGGGNLNREVDLDMLPTELFTKLTVSKSPTAAQVEGGAAGVVDLRSARPFDNPGKYVAASVDGKYNSGAKSPAGKASLIASQTFGDTFGVLVGLSGARNKIGTRGFETVGWTNPALSAAQNTGPGRNATGGGNWTIPATVPAGAGNGLVPGTVIDQAFLLARNPGLNIAQIDNALLPRLLRNMSETGTKDRGTGIVSLEYRPFKELQFYLDTMYTKKENQYDRADMNWVLRNSGGIPLNMTVDRSDCTNGCVATGATFANTQNFLEFRRYNDDASLSSINPGMQWKLTDKLTWTAQANVNKSYNRSSSPTVLPITPLGNGNTMTYDNTGNRPVATSSIDLNDPANFAWTGGRVNIQSSTRLIRTNGLRTDLNWGDTDFSVKVGAAYDTFKRRTTNYDNSQLWQNAVCGNNPSPNLPAPNSSPACTGAVAPGSAAALYPAYGTGATAGATTPAVYTGSLIPNPSAYLDRGPDGFVLLDWERFARDSNYNAYHAAEVPQSNSGYISEKTSGFFVEGNGKTEWLGYGVRYNGGVRYARTRQVVGSINTSADPRNTAAVLSGARYPDLIRWTYLDKQYSKTLPSASVALDLSKNLIVRTSLSRTMTRANPDQMRPGISFFQPSADTGTIGNANLAPYISDNLDLGLEWYTGKEGYMSATYFHKKIGGFTVTDNITTPFRDLAQYGVTYDSITPLQRQAIDIRGGPDVATTIMAQSRNASGKLIVDGVELGWVQPLDKWLPIRGFGFNENMTFVHQRASGEGASSFVSLGVPKKSNNLTVYYERDGYMARFSHTYSDGFQTTGANQNGVTSAALFQDTYKQLDFSASFELDRILDKDGWPTITADVSNVNNATQRTYFQYTNAPYTNYQAGRTFGLGLRMKF